jgi:four helix bundle protein
MAFAVATVKFCRTLPSTWDARRIGGQLIDSSTSMAINYRASGRGRSTRDFIAKLGTVVEEADESVGWYEMIRRLELARGVEFARLYRESQELLAIFAASQITAKENYRRALVIKRAERRSKGSISAREASDRRS